MNTAQLQELLKYCKTDTQTKTLSTLISHNGSVDKTAEELGIQRRAIEKVVQRVKSYAQLQGYSPEHDMTHPTNDSFFVKGVSTYYGKDGEVSAQWVKTNLKATAEFEIMKDAIDGLLEDIKSTHVPVEAPMISNDDLITVYNMGDPHIGAFSWAKETGEDFDLKIASQDLRAAMKALVASSPASKQCLLIDLGDYFHADSMDNATRKSGNVLDVDTRWAKVLQIGLDIMVELVEDALLKHETVTVVNAIGNHNEHSAVFISAFLLAWFRNDPRVIIDDTPGLFSYHQFGKCLIGVTHGHTTKASDLPEIMAFDCEKIWSETEFRYWYTGHVHHDQTKEYRTCKVETFRTLAARDAWHAGQGYRSGRDMKAIVLHRNYGEIQRNTVNVVMLRDQNIS